MFTEESRRLDVYLDGDCSLCQMSRSWCEHRDPDGRFRFIDFRAAADEGLPLTREEHEMSMWVLDDDGTLLGGFAAWRRIMSELPRWRWLARLFSMPPLTFIGPPLYRLIAANRSRFTRLLGLNLMIVNDQHNRKIRLPADYAYDNAKPKSIVLPNRDMVPIVVDGFVQGLHLRGRQHVFYDQVPVQVEHIPLIVRHSFFLLDILLIRRQRTRASPIPRS